MKHLVRPAIWLLVVFAVSAGVSMTTAWSFWSVFGILAVATAAILANGFFATLEDDLPGGFNNPDGKSTPRYAVIVGWFVRGVIVLFGAVVVALFASHFYGSP